MVAREMQQQKMNMVRHNAITVDFDILKLIFKFKQPFFNHLIRTKRAATQGRPYPIRFDFAEEFYSVMSTYSNEKGIILPIIVILQPNNLSFGIFHITYSQLFSSR